MEDKIRGMLIGHTIGDCLGNPYEWRYNSKYTYTGKIIHPCRMLSKFQGSRYGVLGQASDDTEMTICLAQGLVDNNNIYKKDYIVKQYLDWCYTSGAMGIGTNTRKVLSKLKTVKGYQNRYDKLFTDADLSTLSESNGPLMRCSPLVCTLDPLQSAKEDTCITNPNPNVFECESLYLTVLGDIVRGGSGINILEELYTGEQDSETQKVLKQVLEGESRDIEGKGRGWCMHALYASLYCLKHFEKLEDALDWCIGDNRKSDTDTIAAISGALLGAKIGFESIKEEEKSGYNWTIIKEADTSLGDFKRDKKYHPKRLVKLGRLLAENMDS